MTKKNSGRFMSLRKTAKDDAILLFRAFFHKKTPMHIKILIILMIIYIFSPIDIIPDFLPILGIVDDVTLIVFSIKYIKKLIPNNLQEELLGNVIIGK